MQTHTTMSLSEFEQEYFGIAADVPNYRYGQHFISTFIKDSSGLDSLWREKDLVTAMDRVYALIEDYKWDLSSLIVVRKTKEET